MQKCCPVPLGILSFLQCLVFIILQPVPVHSQTTNPLINSGDLLTRGSALHDSGEYQKAIALYQQIDRNDSNYIRALYELAVTYAADSQFQTSVRYCQQALALHAEPFREPDLYNQYGNSIDAGGDPKRALKIYDSAILKYPASSLLYLNKGTTLLKLKRYKEAEEVFQRSLLVNPYLYSAHFKLAVVALDQGKVIPAFLGLVGYLLMNPEGRYFNSSIKLLVSLSHNEDVIQKYVTARTEQPSDNSLVLEQILQSKIALNKDYKLLVKLDDVIFRQIQVIFEKMTYDPSDPDFYMQYYVPFFKKVYETGAFEPFLYHSFANVNLPEIQDYLKKNKKVVSALVQQTVDYFNVIQGSRELAYSKRNTDTAGWLYSDSKLLGKGRYHNNGDTKYGPWEYYYSAGNISATGAYNENGKREGPWVFYYFNGMVKGREFYRDGKQEGEETYFFQNGERSTHSYYANNEKDGESTSYFLVGIPQVVVHYKAGKENGKKITYFSSGRISYEENFKIGLNDGPTLSWFQNGQLEYTAVFVNGKLEGPYKKYYSGGQLEEEGQYAKDKEEGDWKYYYANGQFKGEAHFTNGIEEGEYKGFSDNGKLSSQLQYRKGKLSGEARYYDRDEKLYSIASYENDMIKTATYFDKAGKQVGQSERKSKLLDLTTYLPDGSKRSVAQYNGKGNINGKQTFYYPTGEVFETDEYQDGQEEGPSIGFYLNGRQKTYTDYSKAEKDGYHQTFYTNGQVNEEGWNIKNQMQGYWLVYNELGKLTDSNYYSDNNLNGYRTEYLPDGKKQYETKYNGGWIDELIQYDTAGAVLQHLRFKSGSCHYRLLYPSGSTYIESEYVHGSTDGPRRVYYFDGKLMLEEYYNKGLRDSITRSYSHTGRIIQEGQYKMGEKTGTWKNYWENGSLNHIQVYKNGREDGVRVDYFEDGSKEIETEYRDDEKNGSYRRYDPDGTLLFQVNFEQNNPVSYSYLDKNGQLLPAIPILLNTVKIRSLFPNGQVSAEREYRDGLQTGNDKLYYTNGQLRASSVMENGNTEGPYLTYYRSGKKHAEYMYLHDNPHGPYKVYNEMGIVTEAGNYYNGIYHGTDSEYDEKGVLKQESFYYYGELLSIKK